MTIAWSCEKWQAISWPMGGFHPPPLGLLGLRLILFYLFETFVLNVLIFIYCCRGISTNYLLNIIYLDFISFYFQIISEKSDTEWKFSRTKLWISFFETGSTVPPPFNIMPTPKVDTIPDFLIKLGIKPRMHLWEISIFSVNNVIVRPKYIPKLWTDPTEIGQITRKQSVYVL